MFAARSSGIEYRGPVRTVSDGELLMGVRCVTARWTRRPGAWIRTVGIFAFVLAAAVLAACLGAEHWKDVVDRLRRPGDGLGMQRKDSEDHHSFCGLLEEHTELHTRSTLHKLQGVRSATRCCAECMGNPECRAWSWGEKRDVVGFSDVCLLKKLEAGEEPQRVRRQGVVSGVLDDRLRLKRHGVVAQLLTSWDPPEKRGGEDSQHGINASEVCPGELNITGHGLVSVAATLSLKPGKAAQKVEMAEERWGLQPHLTSRAYFADNCTAGDHGHVEYTALRLLGRRLRYSVDLSRAGCGCNAQLHLVPMSARSSEGEEDHFCDAIASAGRACNEVAVQDANQYAWSSAVHATGDKGGASVGCGGGTDETIGRRNWSVTEYGPRGSCIDTTWPFEVSAAFPTDSDGELKSMEVTLSQQDRSCALSAKIEEYSFRGKERLAELSKILEAGVTPFASYWSSKELAWLDGVGMDGRGPCLQDVPEACPTSVRFFGFSVEDIVEQKKLAAEEHHSLFATALGSIHQKLLREREAWKAEALANATLLKSSVAAQDCGDDCDSAGITVAGETLGGTTAAVHEEHMERQEGNSEWVVVFKSVHVRAEPSFKARIVDERLEGETVIGRRSGQWIKLANLPGFVAISKGTATFLRERSVTYTKLTDGTCGDANLHSITDRWACQAAAFALGYFDLEPKSAEGVEQGCHLVENQLRMVSGKGSRKHGGSPLCVDKAYATTTTTTYTSTTSSTSVTSTTTTSTTWLFPSLFCFEVMQTTTYEFGLVKEQIRRGVGIFLCDEYAVFSQDPETSLGRPPHGPKIKTIRFKKAVVGLSKDGTAGNTLLFMHIWEAVKKDGRWHKHDWTIKADPDAVVLPWRVRNHLRGGTGPNNYLVNCNKFQGPPFPMIYGAFEAYSNMSMTTYFTGGDMRCRNELQWQPWGEDLFMHHCMHLLGVWELRDFSILGDKRCMGANCGDNVAAAYHDFKDQNSWFQCWTQAMR